jgi:hypothetical protein
MNFYILKCRMLSLEGWRLLLYLKRPSRRLGLNKLHFFDKKGNCFSCKILQFLVIITPWIRIRIDLKYWILIRIETSADSQQWFFHIMEIKTLLFLFSCAFASRFAFIYRINRVPTLRKSTSFMTYTGSTVLSLILAFVVLAFINP